MAMNQKHSVLNMDSKHEIFYPQKDGEVIAELRTNPIITVHDTIKNQLVEAQKSIGKAFEAPKNADLDNYGVWVYYPWINTLVHLLPQNEFYAVRTSKNQLTLTKEEQDSLQTKTVGVVGMSVGAGLAFNLALERICAKLLVADFDTLELTNMNRIRCGVHELGCQKVEIFRRAVAVQDPFIEVEIFPQGITASNIQDFISKCDIVADECDNIQMKFMIREEAKKRKIPVIMDTSDSGYLDIERFDLEPERKIFHGLLKDPNVDLGTYAKTLYPQLSDAMRRSFEVGKITQPGTEVAFGASVCAIAVREILLGKHTASGQTRLDIIEHLSSNLKYQQVNAKPIGVFEYGTFKGILVVGIISLIASNVYTKRNG